MRNVITGIYQYYFEDMKLIISSNSLLMNPFTINYLHLANDSSCKHLLSGCLLILSSSGFTCSKQYFKSCSKMLILKFSPQKVSL